MTKVQFKISMKMRNQYHYLSYGWIIGGIIRAVTGQHFKDFVRQRIATPLGVQSEFYVGLDVDNTAVRSRIAKLRYKFSKVKAPQWIYIVNILGH